MVTKPLASSLWQVFACETTRKCLPDTVIWKLLEELQPGVGEGSVPGRPMDPAGFRFPLCFDTPPSPEKEAGDECYSYSQ